MWSVSLNLELENLPAFLALEANRFIGYGNFDLVGRPATAAFYPCFFLFHRPSEPFVTRTSREIIEVALSSSVPGIGTISTLEGPDQIISTPLWNWHDEDFAARADLKIKESPLEEIFGGALCSDLSDLLPRDRGNWKKASSSSLVLQESAERILRLTENLRARPWPLEFLIGPCMLEGQASKRMQPRSTKTPEAIPNAVDSKYCHSTSTVTPAKAGVQRRLGIPRNAGLDSGLDRNDEARASSKA